MENLLFIKFEIIILILSFFYILYFSSAKIFQIYFKVKRVINPEKIENKKSALNKVSLNLNDREIEPKKSEETKLTHENKEKVTDIIKRVKINVTKGYYDFAKNLIVEGLSIDKFNRELNLELANIYEIEKKYLNAEYIYNDLLKVLKLDFEVMKKLGYVLALQNKLEESLDIYEVIHKKKMADDEVINILSELTFNMEDYKKALKYANLYLVSKPRDVDKLFIKAKSLEELKKNTEASQVYKRILELQPYNTRAKEILKEIDVFQS
ncbi:MAG: hypothetical protein PHS49_05750 [Candidatus Gracilibacteria bacterium]|nr:hypothetical protein [Candidatus Gracilibacteria bacterium]